MVRKFYLSTQDFVASPLIKYLSDNSILNSISNTNKKWLAYTDPKTLNLIVEAENAPSSLCIYGLHWHEFGGE